MAGVRHFLALAASCGYETQFLGAAQPVEAIINAIHKTRPEMVALSYRLMPQALENLLERLSELLPAKERPKMVFGGTDENCRIAEKTGMFDAAFGSGARESDVLGYIRGEAHSKEESVPPGTLVERILANAPYPLIRHHFGQVTVDETVAGARRIAEAKVLDVLSLGPDQNAQESFFRPEEMDPAQDGAGGVPIRTEADLERIYQATRTGNYPLVRCYSGTRDITRMASVLKKTIDNAWAAVPLFWYNVLDRRSKRPLFESIVEAQEAIRWHAENQIPVEVNDSHQWSLRSAPEPVAVAAFYLAAYNAKRCGVSNYIGQFMFNTPAGTLPHKDLAKMLAKISLASELEDESFRVWRQTRTGLASMPADQEEAIGHLCASITIQLAIRPHIVHVVGYSEASHAATAEDLISSVKIGRGAISSLIHGLPDATKDPRVEERRDELIAETRELLDAIRQLAPAGVSDPLADPRTLTRAVECGLMDAPDLAGNKPALGQVRTEFIDGACVAVDESGHPIPERQRIARCLEYAKRELGIS